MKHTNYFIICMLILSGYHIMEKNQKPMYQTEVDSFIMFKKMYWNLNMMSFAPLFLVCIICYMTYDVVLYMSL